VIDNELAEEKSGAVRAMCSQHRVVYDVMRGTGVTAARRLSAWRSVEVARLTGDVRMSKDHPHDVHVQRLASADTTIR